MSFTSFEQMKEKDHCLTKMHINIPSNLGTHNFITLETDFLHTEKKTYKKFPFLISCLLIQMKKFEINPSVQMQNNKIKIPSQSKTRRLSSFDLKRRNYGIVFTTQCLSFALFYQF